MSSSHVTDLDCNASLKRMKEPKIKAGSVSHLVKQRNKIFPNVYRLKAVELEGYAYNEKCQQLKLHSSRVRTIC